MREVTLALTSTTAAATGVPVSVPASVHVPTHPSSDGRTGGPVIRWPPVLLFPGARGDHAAAHLAALASGLAAGGVPVVRARLSDRAPGSGFVGRAELAVGRACAVLAAARVTLAEHVGPRIASDPWIVGGASFGGRVASLAIAAQGGRSLGVGGLLAVAYPLHPPGRPERPRTAHWPHLDVPVLLLSGDADPFLSLDVLDAHRARLPGPVTEVLVAGAAHDLSVAARRSPDGRRRAPQEVVAAHVPVVLDWLAGLAH